MSLALAVALTGCSREPGTFRLEFPGAAGSAQARLTSGADDAAVLSWLEPDGGQTALKFALLDADGVGSPAIVKRSDAMFVNWADFPSVTPITDTFWFAHWLQRRPGSGAYDVATLVSVDGGSTWADAEQMNEDDAVAEHGFVSVFPWGDDVAAFWLDGRELANFSFDDPDALLPTSLRLARYDRTGSVTSREVVDEMVCDCCQPDVAMTRDGPIVAYRDRTEDEIRDVVVRRWQGEAFSAPQNLGNEGWFIEGCPVNGPAIAAYAEHVAVAWFTAPEGRGRVRFARSGDSGASFAPAIDVDTDGALGQTGIAVDDDGRVVVTWWRRNRQGGIDLMARAYDVSNRPDAEMLVAHEAIGQPIDVPQLLAADGAYYLAWTTFDDDGAVRLVRLEL